MGELGIPLDWPYLEVLQLIDFGYSLFQHFELLRPPSTCFRHAFCQVDESVDEFLKGKWPVNRHTTTQCDCLPFESEWC